MRVAINGLGRIGRQVLRQMRETDGLELAAVNDLAEPACLAHLVKFDSVHGRAGFPVSHGEGCLVLDGRQVPLFREADPARVPFGARGAQVVLECTGSFASREQAALHLRDGVRLVVVGAPCPDADLTVLAGATGRPDPARHRVISAACATSHALAVLVRVLDGAFGVEGGLGTAVESYGNDQRILDLPHPDPRMARAAALSMIPAPSEAAACLGRALPAMAGKFAVQAVRVPTPDVSLLDLSVTLARDATHATVREAFLRAADGPLRGLLEVLEEPLVSVDLRGSRASCTLDALLTRIMAPRFVKVFGWFDNEAAYAARLVDLCRLLGEER
ncbi:MAG: type I glyceraldehyde-3-phosphate dehydrogenase [Holophaga sp.]|jgi:glyceraldehyde 3-phosphate dehydrogenase